MNKTLPYVPVLYFSDLLNVHTNHPHRQKYSKINLLLRTMMSFCDSFLVLFLLLHCTFGEVSHERVEPAISCLYNAVILIDCLTSFQNWYLTMQNRFHGNEQTNDARNLFLLSNADVTIANPSNNTLIESNSFDVECLMEASRRFFRFCAASQRLNCCSIQRWSRQRNQVSLDSHSLLDKQPFQSMEQILWMGVIAYKPKPNNFLDLPKSQKKWFSN